MIRTLGMTYLLPTAALFRSDRHNKYSETSIAMNANNIVPVHPSTPRPVLVIRRVLEAYPDSPDTDPPHLRIYL